MPPMTSRATKSAGPSGGRQTWRSLDERASSAVADAFAEFDSAFAAGDASRRDLLRIMAASLALGAVSGCGDASAPSGVAMPYVNAPEQQVPGRPRFYASATLFEGYAQPVVVETHEGRPTKIEGNPDHPLGNGGTDIFTQASVLQYYDPDRSQTVRRLGNISTWATFERELLDLRQGWDATRGAGLRMLTGAITSPTVSRQIDRLRRRWPEARWHGFTPVGYGLREAALRQAFGEPLSMHHVLEQAEVVVALEEDLLGPGPFQVRNAGGWAARHRAALAGSGDCALFVAEPTPTLTGAAAQLQLPVASRRIAALAVALAGRLGVLQDIPAQLAPEEAAWVQSAADAVRAHPGRSLIAIGPFQPVAMQVLAFRINQALGARGTTVFYTDPIARPIGDDEGLAALAADMASGAVDTLIVLDSNPVYTAPGDIAFGDLLRRVPHRLHAGLFHDETAELCHWHLPLSHALETWSDARAVDGTVSVLQPTVHPIYDTRGPNQIIALLLGEPADDAQALVAETWRQTLRGPGVAAADVEEQWRADLRAGFVAGSTLRPREVQAAAPPIDAAMPHPPGDQMEVVFRPDANVWDGQYANCAWLQELPKPLTKLAWDNVLGISPALAAELVLRNGDLATITASDNRIVAPVWILPGQADRTVTAVLGYGRTRAGRVGDNIGYDAYRLRRSDALWRIAGVSLASTGSRVTLASTQARGSAAGHDIIRTISIATLAQAKDGPATPAPQPSLYTPWPEEGPAWAMAIDLDLCIGCNSCTVACQAENNVPVVGKEQVALGREMHWLRIDRYYEGPSENPATHFMPVPCMHCEKAPCEVGCPVNATVHGNGGLNEMVYNRCIGTRTCSSYCPYKVRRFNWLDYTEAAAPSTAAQRNPDVTVRARGVMEKCTYCIQRIAAVTKDAHVQNRPVRDGEIVPACQQACPTAAIMFGDVSDPESRVSLWKKSPRTYALLEHLGTRPRTTYLAAVEWDAPPVES